MVMEDVVERKGEGGRGLPGLMRAFVWVSIGLTVLSWVVAYGSWRLGYEERGGMWAHYDDRFTDLTHYDAVFPYLHQRQFFLGAERFAYPAPAAVVYDVLLQMGRWRFAVFFGFTALVVMVPAVWFWRRLVREGLGRRGVTAFVAVLVVCSWPLLFLLERANVETVLIALTFLGAAAFWRGRPVAAAVLWGLAGALKIYPLLLLVLFLTPGRMRAFWAGLGTAAAALGASFWFVGPTMGIAARGTVEGITGFVGSYAARSREWELRHDHSFLAFLKQPLAIHRLHFSADVSHLSTVYAGVAGVAVGMLYILRFRRLPVLNQYMLLVIAMVALPPVSYDYTLMHLYPSFALLTLLVVRARRGVAMPSVAGLFWCFLLLFASENFAFWVAFHLNGMVKAAALFWAAVLLLRYPLPEPAGEEDATAPLVCGAGGKG